ncbi:hypothetical protein FOA52_004543 [Chlamydomonas sp. UWO 241]|nr:hypothetical protein FOA52_004543 [Chlamydomonas sp. UWO 241]
MGDDDGYGSDGFDDYEDEFEKEEEYEVLPQARPSAQPQVDRTSLGGLPLPGEAHRPPSGQGRSSSATARPVITDARGPTGDFFVDAPPPPTLNDAQLTQRVARMARAIIKFPKARFAADRGQMITIVSAYSPTEAASDEEAGDFYLRVAALADKANDKRDLLIVAGGSQRRAWDSSQLRRPAVRREFNLQLSDRFGLLEAVPPEGADAQAEYDAMAAAIREVATNHLAPRGSRRRRGWQFTLSQRTLRLMDARQRAHTAWLRSKSAAAKRERNRANRAADAAVQRDRERWIGQQVAEAQDMLRKKNLRQFARACDRLAGRSRSHQIPPAMRDVSGALHSGPDGVLKAMTESFDKLYGGETKLSDETLNQMENDVAAFELTRATEVDEAHGRPPDLAETEACLRLEHWIDDEIFTLGALSEYDLAMMGRGMYAGKKVGAAQTNDDAKEEEVQTEPIEDGEYACQAPDDRTAMTDDEINAGTVSGTGTYTAATANAGSGGNGDKDVGGVRTGAAMRILSTDPGLELRLAEFVRWAGPQILAALGVSAASRDVALGPDPASGSGLSGGAVHLSSPGLLATRPVTALAVSSAQGEPLLLAAYGPMGAQLGGEALMKDHSLATKGVLAVWDLSSPGAGPKAVLVSEGAPSACGFCPHPASHVVFAGMDEGGLCVWDLEEPAARHPVETLPEAGGKDTGTLVCRRPAFTTEGMLSLASAGAPIVAVVAVPHAESRSTPAHLYSLSAWGDVNVWAVNILSPAEARGMDMEIGMRVGSCVRLLRLASGVKLGLPALWPSAGAGQEPGALSSSVQARSLAALPAQRAFLVGADAGRVLKGSWAGLAPAPKEYVSHDHASAACLTGTGRARVPSIVTDVQLSPHVPWAFLSGHDDGTVTLHSVGQSTAAAVWPGAAPGGVAALRWSPSRPAQFFVLDGMCTVHAFDLAHGGPDGGPGAGPPVASQSFMAADMAGNASLAGTFEVGAPFSGSHRLPGFAVGYDDGRVDFMAFGQRYAAPRDAPAEAALLAALVGPDLAGGTGGATAAAAPAAAAPAAAAPPPAAAYAAAPYVAPASVPAYAPAHDNGGGGGGGANGDSNGYGAHDDNGYDEYANDEF